MQDISDNKNLKDPLNGMGIIPMKKIINEKGELNKALHNEISSTQKYLQENLKEFDINVDIVNNEKKLNFAFPLPQTVFKEIQDGKDAPAISFQEQNFEVERLQVRELSAEQQRSIRNDGTFEVQSQRFNVPYKWKVSEMIILGNSVLKNVFFYHLAHVNGNFWKVFSRIYSGTDYKCDIYKGIKAALYKPLKNIFSLVFGKKQMTNSQYLIDFIKQRRNKIQLDKYLKRSEIRPLQEFYLQLDPKMNDSINIEHKNYFNNIKQQVQEENEKYQKKYLAQLSKSKQIALFREKLNQEDKIPDEVKKDFLNIARALYIVEENEQKYKDAMYFCPIEEDDFFSMRRGPKFGDCLKRQLFSDYNYTRFKRAFPTDKMRKYQYAFDKRNRIEQEIKDNYPVLGKHPGYKVKLLKEKFKKEDDYEQGLKVQKIMNQLNEEGLSTQLEMYKSYLEYRKDWPTFKKDFLKKYLDTPQYDYIITQYLAYPSEIITVKQQHQQQYQYIKTTENYKVNSDSHFWKLKLFAKEFLVFTYNISTFLFKGANICFKKVFLVKPFTTEYKIENNRIVPNKDRATNTIISTFIKNYNEANQKRIHYESIPDDQFLRKRYGRLFNLFKIYFLKLFLVDFLMSLVIFPVILLSFGILGYAGTILSPALALGFQALIKTFSLIIYDYRNWKNLNYLAYFPLVSVVGQSAIGVFQIAYSTFMIGFDILRMGIHTVLAILRYALLYVYNTFTFYLIIKPLARVPVSESPICYRIGGPGVGKQDFFYTIQEDDVALLVRAEMERIQLQNYQSYVNKQIDQIQIDNTNIVKSTNLLPYHFLQHHNIQFADLNKQIEILKQKLSSQVNSRNLNYPKSQNMQRIRFKADELETNLKITEEIVAVFLDPQTSQEVLRKVSQNVLKKIFQNPDIIKPLRLDQWQFNLVQQISDDAKYQSIKKKVRRNIKSNLGSGSVRHYEDFGGSSKYMQEFKLDGGNYAGIEEDDESQDEEINSGTQNINSENGQVRIKIVDPSIVLQELDLSSVSYNYQDTNYFFVNFGHFRDVLIQKMEEEEEKRRKEEEEEKEGEEQKKQ